MTSYTDGDSTIRVSFLEPGYYRLDHSLGATWVLSGIELELRIEEWLSRGWRAI
jgi:hypothetical protein